MSAPESHEHAAAADHGHHDISKHVKSYFVVGGLLLVFTVITVALSYVDFGSMKANFIIAMIVATFKAGLVAAIFMHLLSERWTIYRFLILTVFFCLGLFLLSLLAWYDHPHL